MTAPVPSADPTPEVPAAPAPAPTPAPPAVPPAAPPAPAPAADPAAPPATGQTHFDAKYVGDLRSEAAGHRVKAQEEAAARAAAEQAAAAAAERAEKLEQMLQGLNKVLNPDAANAETPPDPAKLAEQLEAAQRQREADVAERDAKIRELTVTAALPSVFQQLQVDPKLTRAVLVADGTLAKLDPSSKTFTADLESAVKAALEANPQLKTAPVAVRSGSEIAGRAGGTQQLTREEATRLAKEDPAALVKAQAEGRLANLGIGGRK